MAEKTTIKINPTKPSKLEFDVTITGLDDIKPKVRFVLCKVHDGVDWVVSCTSVDGDRWAAHLPALGDVKANTLQFRVEVIADEYFFTPARGEVSLVAVKDVEFASKTKKPSVSASFSVSQDDTNIRESANSVVGETAAGETSPTTSLLSPEPNPDEEIVLGNPGVYDVGPDDQPDNEAEYSASVVITHDVPGETTMAPAEFDARQVAHSIIKSKMGNISRPEKPGTLFNRLPGGRAVVQGLEAPDVTQEMALRAARVKEILKQV